MYIAIPYENLLVAYVYCEFVINDGVPVLVVDILVYVEWEYCLYCLSGRFVVLFSVVVSFLLQ